MFKSILVPTDGSKLALKAVTMASKLAASCGAKLTVITALPSFPTMAGGDGYMMSPVSTKQWEDMIKKRANTIKQTVSKQLKDIAFDFLEVASEQPYVVIVAAAKKRKCDLIVMASHGRGGLSQLLMGSETTKVLAHSTIPVLVCR